VAGEIAPDRRNLRVSHEDRDNAVERLQAAAADGRLNADELDERVESALTARTYGELEVLFDDLPAASGAVLASVPAPAPAARESVHLQTTHGNIHRTGRWLVPRRLTVEVRHGNVVLDFTEAVISEPVLDLEVSLRHGNMVVRVPSEVVVDTDDLELGHGSVSHRVRPGPDAQVRLRISVSGSLRHGSIVVKGPRRPRRSFWAWLLRRPLPAGGSRPRNAIGA
jgi:hypothetical protein